MAIRHSITLSTTEPNNEIGVIKIRQADEQTQTLDVQITENGVPKSYQGLAVYFCAKLGQTAGLGIIEQKLKPEEMTNPANGKLEYTMRAEDWQILGRQKGYFSFRKMKNEHEFIEQFTTRDFTFEVIKSVYSDGLKEVKKDGSTYVWTIEDMLRLFDEYIASGKTDWEEFVEQNREILESVDPGGKILGEIAEVSAQLAQTDKKIPLIANSTGKLSILSPYNHYENIHPKVLYFSNGWNGFKYWMAYTPYKNSDIKEENPCIAVSNDGINWITPDGLTNPLDPWPGSVTQYHNDTHLVFRSDLNRLEVWYRTADTGNNVAYLKRKTSTDGITWSAVDFLYTGAIESNDHISPAALYEDGKYKMLSVYRKNGLWVVNYRESADAKNWSARQDINVPSLGNMQLWHLDFIKTGMGYEMVVTGFDTTKGETTNSANLYYLTSQDLINWTKPEMILRPTGLDGTFDGAGIYRSTLLKVDKKYRLYYSAVGKNAERGIGLSIGDTPKNLIGQSIVSNFNSVILGGKNSVILEDDPNVINKINIKQGTNPNGFGHLGIANLFFEDRYSNTTTPKNGLLSYSASQNILQRYSEGSFRGISTILLTKLTTTINLTTGENATIPFNAPVSQSTKYSGGVYTPNGEERLKISVGLTLADAPSGGVELTIANASTNAPIGYLYRKSIATTGGNEYLNGQFVLETSAPFKIMIKYTGSAAPRITQFTTQNYLLIENV